MTSLTVDSQARRVRNLTYAESRIVKCRNRHFVNRYFPGAVTYNLSEYPYPSSIAPTEYDHELLATLAAGGVELIELHEEWNDVLRLYGGDKYTTYDPKGLREFIDLVHSFGMRIICYMSTGFFQKTDPDFRESFIRYPVSLREIYYDYVVCSPESPEWRAYLLPRLERILDEYGFDGLYNDTGYDQFVHDLTVKYPNVGLETVETDYELKYDPAFEDLLGQVMTMTHERNGISKVHISWDLAPNAYSKVYDYLWVGECVQSEERLRERTRDLAPYVVPCPDYHMKSEVNHDDIYLNSIPMMQFPLRIDGRPVTGERAFTEGIEYRQPVEEDHWSAYFRAVHEFYKANPDGPYTYGTWDGVAPPADARARWLQYLKLYKPMVAANTRCWLDVEDSGLCTEGSDLSDTVMSVFANDELYLVVANYATTPKQLEFADAWTDRESNETGRSHRLEPRSLRFFLLADVAS